LNRERHDKIRTLTTKLKAAQAENERLKSEFAAKPTARSLTEVEQALAKYEASKQKTGGQQ